MYLQSSKQRYEQVLDWKWKQHRFSAGAKKNGPKRLKMTFIVKTFYIYKWSNIV